MSSLIACQSFDPSTFETCLPRCLFQHPFLASSFEKTSALLSQCEILCRGFVILSQDGFVEFSWSEANMEGHIWLPSVREA